jgi:hypothetical protein
MFNIAYNIQPLGCGNSIKGSSDIRSTFHTLEQLLHSKGGKITDIIFSQHFLLFQKALKRTYSNVEIQIFSGEKPPNAA